MRSAHLRLHLVLLVGVLAGGCGRPTEIVLLGASDLPLDQIGAVEVVVTSSAAGAMPESRCVCLSAGCASAEPSGPREGRWPISVGLRPGRSEDPPFLVELRGHAGSRCDDTAVLTQQARARFRSGHRLLLRMSLAAACLNRSCDAVAETCREGACVPIDFPLEAYDNTPLPIPLSPDLASEPADLGTVDLEGADLAGVDAAVDPSVPVMFSAGFPAPSPPAIARTPGGYVITTCRAGFLDAYFISDTDVVSGPALLWKGCRSGVAPATAIDGMGRAVTLASLDLAAQSRRGSAFVVHTIGPGNPSIVGPFDELDGLPADQVTINIQGGTAHLFSLTGGNLHQRVFPGGQYVNQSTVDDSGSALFMAASIADSGDAARWSHDSAGAVHLRRSGDVTSLSLSSPPPAISSLAAASASAMHALVMSAGANPRSIKYTWAPEGTIDPAVSFKDFNPPIQVNVSALSLNTDQFSLVLAHSDGFSIFEAVLAPTELTKPSAASAAPARLIDRDLNSTGLDGVAYAPSSSLGGGRYVWRELTNSGGLLRSRRRNPSLP